jgi:hypothetical protein
MLAYVFWHWPAPDVERGRYLDRLVAFHRALRAAPPPGFRGSRVLAVEGAPWLPSAPAALEDWYLVDDFAALGALNDAAITAARQAPHDAVARLAGGGTGGLYRRLSSGGGTRDETRWFAKPPGESYAALAARLPEAEAWQRQLVLGPAPEFCVFGAAPSGVAAVTVRSEVVDDAT